MKKLILSAGLALSLSLTACGPGVPEPVAVPTVAVTNDAVAVERTPTPKPAKTTQAPEPVVEVAPEPVALPEPVVAPEPVPVVEVAPVVPEPVAVVPEPVQAPVAPVVVPEPVVPVPVVPEPVVVPVAPEPVEEFVPQEFHEPTPPGAPVHAPLPPEPVERPWQYDILEAQGLSTAGLTIIVTDTEQPPNCGGVGGGCAIPGGKVIWLSLSASNHVMFHEYAHAMVPGIGRDECAAEVFAQNMTGDRTMASYGELCFGWLPR